MEKNFFSQNPFMFITHDEQIIQDIAESDPRMRIPVCDQRDQLQESVSVMILDML